MGDTGDSVLKLLQRGADSLEAVGGWRPRMATLAPDVYNRLRAELEESRVFCEFPSDRRIPYRVGDLLISEDEAAAPGHAYFLNADPYDS